MKARRGPPAGDHPDHETVGARRRREKRQQAVAFLAGKPLLAGIDLGKERHAVWLAGRDTDLVLLRRFTIPNSLDGVRTLLAEAQKAREASGSDRLVVFMEATSYFWQNVANVLEAHQVQYRLVSPLAVDRQREVEHLTYAKGDYRDAELIVRLGSSGHWLHCQLERDRLWIELSAFAREHEALLKAQSRERQRVRSLVELALPELLQAFKDPLKKTARALLRKLARPGLDPPSTIEEFLERAGRVEGVRLLRSKLRILVACLALEPSYGVERCLPSALARIALAVDRVEVLDEQRKHVRAKLVSLYETTPYRAVLDTIPGVSPESHALFLGLAGDPRRFDRATCLVKLAGIEPRENASGKAEGSHSISKRGRSPLRHLLHRIILALKRSDNELVAYLAHLQDRKENALAFEQAVVAAGNKYLRLVYRLCVSGEPYDGSRLKPRTPRDSNQRGASPLSS